MKDVFQYVKWTDDLDIKSKNISADDQTVVLCSSIPRWEYLCLYMKVTGAASGSNSSILFKHRVDTSFDWHHVPNDLNADLSSAGDRAGLTITAGGADEDYIYFRNPFSSIKPNLSGNDVADPVQELGLRINLVTDMTALTLAWGGFGYRG
jgi:hypothetical protein